MGHRVGPPGRLRLLTAGDSPRTALSSHRYAAFLSDGESLYFARARAKLTVITTWCRGVWPPSYDRAVSDRVVGAPASHRLTDSRASNTLELFKYLFSNRPRPPRTRGTRAAVGFPPI